MAKPQKIEIPDGLFERFVGAGINLDLDELRASITPDITWLSGGPGWMVQGADAVVSVRSREWDDPNAKVRSVKWIDGPYGVETEDLVCAWGMVQLEVDTKDPPVTAGVLDKRCCLVLRRDAGEWRVHMDCWSRPRVDEYVHFSTDDDPKTVRYYDYEPGATSM